MKILFPVLLSLFITLSELALGAGECSSDFSKLTRERVAALITELARLQLDTSEGRDAYNFR